jgi:Na+/H+ antiporter
VHPVDLVVCLLIVLVALVTVAQRLNVSYPIVLVIGGLVLALFPRLPEVRLQPDIVFLVFLPPLLYWDALNSSWRDLRDNWRPIVRLAIGLVFTTTMAVTLVAHFMLGFLWAPAFVLGAVLGPTDTVATAAILERFCLPRRLLAVVHGESLLNDASALVLYETALQVTHTGTYVLGSVSMGFGLAAGGGVAIGLAIGWLMLRLERLASDSLVRSTIGLLIGFAAYLPADALHVSGVLAVVTAGLYLSWEDPRIMSAKTRLQSIATWEVMTFLLNGLLFILIGLQLRPIVKSFSAESFRSIIIGCLLVTGTVILVRILWVFISAYIQRVFGGGLRTSYPAWQQPTLNFMGWDSRRNFSGRRSGNPDLPGERLAFSRTQRDFDSNVRGYSRYTSGSGPQFTAFTPLAKFPGGRRGTCRGTTGPKSDHRRCASLSGVGPKRRRDSRARD